MDPKHFDVNSFINEDVIKMTISAINSTSTNWMDMFMGLGQIIFWVIASLEFMREALNIAEGKEHNLVGKLIRYAMVGVLITTAPMLVKGFKEIPISSLGLMEYKRAEAQELGMKLVQMQQDQGILTKLWSGAKDIITAPLYALGQICYFFASVTITVIYASYCFLFFVILALAPIAFPFLLSDDLKEIFVNWVSNVISYSITFPLLGIGISLIMNIQYELMFNKVMAVGELNFMEIAVMSLIVSMSSIGIILAAVKAAKHLTGAGGGGEIGAAGVGVAVGVAMSAIHLAKGGKGGGKAVTGAVVNTVGAVATGGAALAVTAATKVADVALSATKKATDQTMKAATE